MVRYKISVTIASPPTDVSLHLNNARVNMVRDNTGEWAGNAELDLMESVPIDCRAVGIASAPWALEIRFMTFPEGIIVKDYKHTDKIPDSLLSIFKDTVSLKGPVVP